MNGMMEYKGYHAKVEYSAEDNAFVGQVFGIADTLVFDGQSIGELETMFHASIDDYLELCQEIGKEPDKEYRGTFNVRVPVELHRAAAMVAEAKGTSLNQFVTEALRRYIATEAR
ncbi:type II toxin-antitoxin system HicB family antitoxin [Oscillospiraceae bacterium 44-34]